MRYFVMMKRCSLGVLAGRKKIGIDSFEAEAED
jgi:hypothetical protein